MRQNGLLSGIRVLDLSRVLAGPLSAMILGDLGADVIKAERKGSGDETRGWGPPFDSRGESAYFLSCNRNKKSVAVDLDDPQDVTFLRALAADADVVIENFRRGALERRGVHAEELLARHQRLIWCTITGFGADSDRPGYDFVVQAELGWMAISGPAEGPPTKSGVALVDVIAGKDTAIAVLAALVARDRGTLDRRLFISLADSARAALVNVAQNALVTGRDATRWGNAHPNLVPYQLFDAEDRPVVLAVGSDSQWTACTRALGLDDLATDQALLTNAGRLADRARVVRSIADRVRSRPAAHWLEALERAGVPCGRVRTVLEALEGSGADSLFGVPPSVPGSMRLPPPRLNEHGLAIRSQGWRVFAEGTQ